MDKMLSLNNTVRKLELLYTLTAIVIKKSLKFAHLCLL
ncbi:unnamed protein product [Brugia timori]|uniref:Uncharacterized protein n=1 Tax=Brugia timori TaxID=42155 RepID=A0A0R3QPT7_9BILA|nr:unnamed protein product [Brugia timori]